MTNSGIWIGGEGQKEARSREARKMKIIQYFMLPFILATPRKKGVRKEFLKNKIRVYNGNADRS